MTRTVLSWGGLFLAGMAVGVLALRIVTQGFGSDSLASAALVEVGLVAAVCLMAVGALLGAFQSKFGSTTGDGDSPKAQAISIGNHLALSKQEHKWALTLMNLGGYDSISITVPSHGIWRLPFTLGWERWQMPFVAVAAIGLAAFGQYRFTLSNSNGTDGVLIYVVAMFLFVTLVSSLEAESSPAALARVRLSQPRQTRSSRVTFWLVGFASLAILVVLSNPNLPRWDQDQTATIAVWVLANIAFLAAFLPWGNLRRSIALDTRSWFARGVNSLHLRSKGTLLIAAIVILAFVVRSIDLSYIPRAFSGDEGEMGASALDVLNGKLINPFITGWMSMPTMYAYAQAFSVLVFGPTIFGIRMLSVLQGTLTVAVTWLLVRDLLGGETAFLSAGLLAVYSAHVHFSRTANPQIQDGLTVVATFFLLYRGLATRRTGYFVAAGLAIGLGAYGYQGGRLFAPVLLAAMLVYWVIADKSMIRGNFGNLLAMIVAVFLAVSPLLIFYQENPSAFTSRLAEVNILTNGYLTKAALSSSGPFPFLLEQLRSSFLAFNLVPEITGFYGLGAPMLDNLSAFFFVFGLAYTITHLRKEAYYFVLAWFVLGVILGGVLIAEPPTSHRLEIVFVPVIICVAIGAEKLIDLTGRLWRPLLPLKLAGLTAVFVALALVNLNGYFVDYTPKQIYGGDPALAATEMGEYFVAYPRPFKAYVLGDVPGFIHIGTLRFICPNLDGQSVDDKLSAPPDFVDTTRDALFVIFPTRTSDLVMIQQGFPQGQRIDFQKADGSLLFYVYEVRS